MLGRANSRLKDFYDIWILSQTYEFSPDRLAQAVAATFKRRDTPIPSELPDGLTVEFAHDLTKQQQWAAFIREVAVDPGSLEKVVNDLAAFLMPIARTAQRSD